MPTYEFKCPNNHRYSYTGDMDDRDLLLGEPCLECEEPLKRVFSFDFPQMVHEHFSVATGSVVRGAKDFKSQLKAASEAATARTGIPHNYEPMSWSELAAASPNPDAGMKETHDTQVAMGLKEPSKKVL